MDTNQLCERIEEVSVVIMTIAGAAGISAEDPVIVAAGAVVVGGAVLVDKAVDTFYEE